MCALVRNDMQKTDACLRLQGRGAQGARKHAGCQRLQGVVRNDMQKTVRFLRVQGGYRFFHRPVITRYTGGSVPLAAPHTAAVRRIFRWPAAMAPTVTL